VEIVGLREKSMNSVVTGVEMFHKQLDRAWRATTAACCCAASPGRRGARHGDCEAGQHHAAHAFMSEVYVLRKEEGGRHKAFFTGTGRSSTSGRWT
jgi:elongation factor Tu